MKKSIVFLGLIFPSIALGCAYEEFDSVRDYYPSISFIIPAVFFAFSFKGLKDKKRRFIQYLATALLFFPFFVYPYNFLEEIIPQKGYMYDIFNLFEAFLVVGMLFVAYLSAKLGDKKLVILTFLIYVIFSFIVYFLDFFTCSRI